MVLAHDNDPIALPVTDGFSMPARFDRHDRTLMIWPPIEEDVGTSVPGFRDEVEAVARSISPFEPVTLIVDPADEEEATARCSGFAEILVIPVDTCWLRDCGPIFVRDADNRVAGVRFDFNGWGGRFVCDKTFEMPAPVIEHLGMKRYQAPFICEGGGISVDGAGTLITTEQVMMNSNRYAHMTREDVEQGLHDYLGIDQVIWLGLGLVEDTETDGHVDNVVEFVAPGVVLTQTTCDTANPNYELLAENLRRLKAARDARGNKLEIIEMDVLPYREHDGEQLAIPYTNAYVCNGAVIAPEVDPKLDAVGYKILEQVYPGREIVPAPSVWQAFGGGGLGCITQQVPAGKPAAHD